MAGSRLTLVLVFSSVEAFAIGAGRGGSAVGAAIGRIRPPARFNVVASALGEPIADTWLGWEQRFLASSPAALTVPESDIPESWKEWGTDDVVGFDVVRKIAFNHKEQQVTSTHQRHLLVSGCWQDGPPTEVSNASSPSSCPSENLARPMWADVPQEWTTERKLPKCVSPLLEHGVVVSFGKMADITHRYRSALQMFMLKESRPPVIFELLLVAADDAVALTLPVHNRSAQLVGAAIATWYKRAPKTVKEHADEQDANDATRKRICNELQTINAAHEPPTQASGDLPAHGCAEHGWSMALPQGLSIQLTHKTGQQHEYDEGPPFDLTVSWVRSTHNCKPISVQVCFDSGGEMRQAHMM